MHCHTLVNAIKGPQVNSFFGVTVSFANFNMIKVAIVFAQLGIRKSFSRYCAILLLIEN